MYSTPYTYLIGWKEENTYYYGVRFSKNCQPSDLWEKYFTSSKYVKKFREKYGEPDVIQVRKTFKDPKSAQIWETKVLKKMNVIKDSRFLNKAIGLSLQDYENRKKLMIEKYGVENTSQLPGVSEKISRAMKGVKKSNIHRKNMSKCRSDHAKKVMSSARNEAIKNDPDKFSNISANGGKAGKGLLWWNNGEISTKSSEQPGIEWKRGRIKTWSSSVPIVKGHKKEVVTCPYCDKAGGKPVMKRFHFDNCKQKNHNNKGNADD
jgi:hypothetical protein